MSNDVLINSKRRNFLKYSATAGGAAAFLHSFGLLSFAQSTKASEIIKMMELPYSVNALEPYISGKTVNRHYNSHHKIYHKKLVNYLNENPEYKNYTLEALITKTKGGILVEETLFHFAILCYDSLCWFTKL